VTDDEPAELVQALALVDTYRVAEERARELKQNLPFDVGTLVGGVADRSIRLAVVRKLWETGEPVRVPAWTLAAAMVIGAPPADEAGRAEWVRIGNRNVYKLRQLLTQEAIPCATEGCGNTVVTVKTRDGQPYFPTGNAQCLPCRIEASRRWEAEHGTFEERLQADEDTRAQRRAELVAALGNMKGQVGLSDAGMWTMYEVLLAVEHFNDEVRSDQEWRSKNGIRPCTDLRPIRIDPPIAEPA
jgi:hypothetical protein